MTFGVFLILAANFIVPSSSQDLTCVLADAAQGAVWTVGVDPPSGITGKCLMDNPMLDVCYSRGTIYIAGPKSTLPGADPSMGGHIARIDSLTCELEIIAEFATACTAIGCADDRLVFALEGVGIKSIMYDGSDEQDHGSIADSFIRNIHIDSIAQTSYFVDITTSFVYAVDYTVNTASAAVAIGITGAGAVGATLDCNCTVSGEPIQKWGYSETEDFTLCIMGVDMTTGEVVRRRKVTTGTMVLGKQSNIVEKLVIIFDQPVEVYKISVDNRFNSEIELELFEFIGDTQSIYFDNIVSNDHISSWKGATWIPENPTDIPVTVACITFGDFQPSLEVKLRNLMIWGCKTSAFAATPSPNAAAQAKATTLNILYDDCTVERCSIDGPFTGCPVLYQSSGSESCLPMSGTTDKVIIHNYQNALYAIDPFEDDVTTISSSAEAVVGMDCSVRFYDPADELCDPNPCMNDGECIPTLVGYSCICPTPYVGDNCEIQCPECDFLTS